MTKFEQDISDEADRVFASGKTGYNWGAVDRILKRELGLRGQTRCKKANNSGRAANVITESMDKPIQLYVIFISQPYTIKQFLAVAKDRIRRFPNAKTIAVFDHTADHWRARAIVERKGEGLAEEIRDHFPAIGDEDVHYVDARPPADELALQVGETQTGDEEEEEAAAAATAEAETEAAPLARNVDVEEVEEVLRGRMSELSGLSGLPEKLIGLAGKRRLYLDRSLAVDLLAVMLSSQFVLFAGPSGTGKSTMARLLTDFFAPDGRRFVIEALRQWLTPDDVAGYYSVLAKRFAMSPNTDTILSMHDASVAPSQEGNDVKGPPILVVEEMNLSAPEGYLAPVVHGLSAGSDILLKWVLRTGGAETVDEQGVRFLPPIAVFGPYPRVLGTINVDASAHAPARKVAARSSVVLLEPVELTVEELVQMASSEEGEEELVEEGWGESFLGDPLAALKDAPEEEVKMLAARLQELVARFDGVIPSHRGLNRSLAYMAYFRRLAGSDPGVEDENLQLAVENAFAHCVLPTVDPGRFLPTLQKLQETGLSAAAESDDALGGLLGIRVERLIASASDGVDFGIIDFWSALS